MSRRLVAPWQLWLADLDPQAGNEQGGLRPSIVVGSELHCGFPIGMAILVPVTTRYRGLPHHVAITSAESGLNRPSWARTDDIRALSTERFRSREPIGSLTAAEIDEVRRWVHRMIAA